MEGYDTYLLPPRNPGDNRLTIVLDLDETLVHCSTNPLSNAHCRFNINWNQREVEIFGRIRPYATELLKYCSQFCEVVVFTASVAEYADVILDYLDPDHHFIHHRLYRDSCTVINQSYVKDLDRLGRPLVGTD